MKVEYCLWETNCSLLRTKRCSSECDVYKCCHFCDDKSCPVRCEDRFSKCKYKVDENHIKDMLEKRNTSFLANKVSNNESEVKVEQVQIPKKEDEAKQQITAKVETSSAKESSDKVIIPHNVADLARLLGVSYDKVNYRVGWKKMSYEETYEALRRK